MRIIRFFVIVFVFLLNSVCSAESCLQERENAALESIPLKQFKNYRNTAELVQEQYTVRCAHDCPVSKEIERDLLYQFWVSSLEAPLTWDEKDFFDALFDLIIWPDHNTIGEGKLIRHEKGCQLFNSFAPLSPAVRAMILSHNVPGLYLQWLRVIKDLNIDCEFHPSFIERLIKKPIQLQKFLSKDVDYIFPQILAHSCKKNKVKAGGGRLDKTIEVEDLSDASFLSLTEAATWILNYFGPKAYGIKVIEKIFEYAAGLAVNGQDIRFGLHTIKDILNNLIQEKASAEAIQFAVSVYLGAHDKKDEKTAIFNDLLKTLKSSETLALIVNWYLDYCYGQKNSSYLKLISREFSPQTRKLAIALHVDCPTQGIEVGETHLKISGVKKENFEALCEVLSCISNSNFSSTIGALDLSHNHLLLLDPLIPSLKGLQNLKKLILSNNPISTLQSIVENLINLQTIVIQGTYIPKFSIHNVIFLSTRGKLDRRLVASTKPIRPDHFNISPEERDKIFNHHCRSLKNDWVERKNWEDKIYENVTGTSISYLEIHTCVMQQLAEKFWKEALALGLKSWREILGSHSTNQDEEIDSLLELLNRCKATQKQAAHKLPYAIKFGFPSGTVEKGLVFDKDVGITPNPTCLTQIAISDSPDMPGFLKTLNQFSNLLQLSLTNVTLTNLDSLPCMPLLKSLTLSHNRITNLSGLRRGQNVCKFRNLRKLKLDHNSLPSHDRLDLLQDFENLVYLDMSFNQLRQTLRFRALRRQLQYLDLSGNYLTKEDLKNWQHIEKFKGEPQHQDKDLS